LRGVPALSRHGPGGADPGDPRGEPEDRRGPEDLGHGPHAVVERGARPVGGMVSWPGRRWRGGRYPVRRHLAIRQAAG